MAFFARFIVSNYFLGFLFGFFSTEFVPSSDGSLWKGFTQNFANEIPQNEQLDDTWALLAELDEVDTALTDRMAQVIPPPPSPAHPTFQKLYLEKKEFSAGPTRAESERKEQTFGFGQQPQQKQMNKKRQWQKLRSLWLKPKMVKKIDSVVEMYKGLKDSPGGWGEIVRKAFTDMAMAKLYGQVNAEGLRNNCQRALKLIEKEGGVGGVQLDKIEPFNDIWALLKSTAQAVVAQFNGRFNGDEKSRRKRIGTFLRVLKTFAEDGKAIKAGYGAGLKTRRRRKRVITTLAIVGIVILCVVLFGTFCEIVKPKRN